MFQPEIFQLNSDAIALISSDIAPSAFFPVRVQDDEVFIETHNEGRILSTIFVALIFSIHKCFVTIPALVVCNASTTTSNENDFDFTDIANYPSVISVTLRERIIHTGPIQVEMEFPKTKDNRSFSKKYYSKLLPNGEEVKRDWLVYSKQLDAVHCFCCRLFRDESQHFALANQGFNDWQNLSTRIKTHEFSQSHRQSIPNFQNNIKQKKSA